MAYGFLGLGAMGSPMAVRLAHHAAAEGLGCLVWNRTRGRADAAVGAGAQWRDSPAEVFDGAEVVVAMLPDLPELIALTDTAATLRAARAGTVLVVCSTVSPSGVREFATGLAAATNGRLTVVDAPVSGGVEGASRGTLTIMAGGSDSAVAAAMPVLRAMGSTIRHVGEVGAGSTAKACQQLVGAAALIAAAEATVLARSAGLDVEAFWDLLESGHASSALIRAKRPNITTDTYFPTSAAAQYLVKDLRIAAEIASAAGTRIAQAELSRDLYEAVGAAGLGNNDVSVVHRVVQDRSHG